MKFSVMQITVMAGKLGDIFWDLVPQVSYTPGYDIGCSIYVANPTNTAKEYALMARLSRDITLVSEEALPVFGYTWFTVDPGDFVELHGALRFTESNAVLTVQLIEKETGEATDSVATVLVAPAAGTTAALPPAWPGATGTATTTWTSMIDMMMPMLMLGMFGMVIVSAFRPKEEEKGVAPSVKVVGVERKALPPGRSE